MGLLYFEERKTMNLRGFEKQEGLVIQKAIENGKSIKTAKEVLRSFRRVARMKDGQDAQRACYSGILESVLTVGQIQGGN